VNVVLRNLQGRPALSRRQLEAIAETVRRYHGVDTADVGVALVDDARMVEWHGRFMNDPTTTDVMSFPAAEPEMADEWNGADLTTDDETYWGDVVVCTDQAARQAQALRHPYTYELAVLVLHGMLHLLGHDHVTDRGAMRRLEERLRPACIAAGAGETGAR
jgi:probable rRNA maturation factor